MSWVVCAQLADASSSRTSNVLDKICTVSFFISGVIFAKLSFTQNGYLQRMPEYKIDTVSMEFAYCLSPILRMSKQVIFVRLIWNGPFKRGGAARRGGSRS